MAEAHLIKHCAPTLAGIKTGSVFTCPYERREELMDSIRALNRRLSPKGLRMVPLRFSDRKALIYLYRPSQLRQDLSDQEAYQILARHGYAIDSCERCVVRLVQRLREEGDFPHEIGLFLGYPPEDVRGFIENRACGFKCVGCWKVYGDEEAAQKLFRQYKKCTQVYCDRWNDGGSIDRLAVADRRGGRFTN